ncbi:hypothetical protein AAHB49_26370 [Bacillus cereus]
MKMKQTVSSVSICTTGTFSKRNARRDAEDYSGFYQGVREVLKARENRLQGIEGLLQNC